MLPLSKQVITGTPGTHQGILETQLRNIFPHLNTIKNARKDTTIKNPQTGGYLEVDVWIPEIRVCFEFQDEYHYKPSWFSHIPLNYVQDKDDVKRNSLLQRGHTLITVPYWWDGTAASLQGTINFQRPDLLVITTNPGIPINALSSKDPGHKPLMLASFPESSMLDFMDKSAWWIGEKWDGIRCCWDGLQKRAYSRHNIEISLHPAVTDLFGTFLLDSELWCGRGFFHEAHNFTLSAWQKLNSSFLRLLGFDEASEHMNTTPFETRYAFVLSRIANNHPLVIIAPRNLCTNEPSLIDSLQSVLDSEGEGLILNRPLSLYIPGRSRELLKIKANESDQEALVVHVESDGSLLLQKPNGLTFSVPRRDVMLPQHAVKGDIVTFSFGSSRHLYVLQQTIRDVLYGVPGNPVVHRIRSDLSWEDIAHDSPQTVHKLVGLEQSTKLQSVRSRPWQLPSQRRAFFDQFAASKGLDPLNPVSWYDITQQELRNYNVGYNNIARYYDRKLSTGLMRLYPDIGLQEDLFRAKPQKQFWSVLGVDARKKFFDNYAASKGADPRNPDFWYSTTATELSTFSGFHAIVRHYGSKVSTALMQLYPDIGLKQSRFKVKFQISSWKTPNQRKAFFDKFAAQKGMDPLNPVFWYGVKQRSLRKFNNDSYSTICRYYGGKLSTTLMEIYPNIGLQQSHFRAKRGQSRKNSHLRRAYFDSFAASKGMDPLNPIFWYSIKHSDLNSYHHGYRTIVQYYNGKLSNALVELYPNIGLQKSRFNVWYWKNSNLQQLFCDYARAQSFDPLVPANWYGDHPKLNVKGINAIVKKLYAGNVCTALKDSFPDIGLETDKFVTL